jgi:DNA-binding FrmR family transcriptional regulator
MPRSTAFDRIPLGVYTVSMHIKDESSKKALVCRLKRAEGQLRGVTEMIENDADCADIAIQLSACRSAIQHALGAFTTCAIDETRTAGSKKRDIKEINRLLKLVM